MKGRHIHTFTHSHIHTEHLYKFFLHEATNEWARALWLSWKVRLFAYTEREPTERVNIVRELRKESGGEREREREERVREKKKKGQRAEKDADM